MSLPASEVTKLTFTDCESSQSVVNGGTSARRIGLNAASLLVGDVFNRGVTFVIYALVASYCGAYSFGQLSLGLMLLYAFQVLASVGLPTLIVRDVAKDLPSDAKYLVNGSVIVCLAFVISYCLLGLFVLVSGYAADTSRVVLLLGLSILPWSLSLIPESIFRANERMHLILVAALPANLVKLGVSFYLLTQGHGVITIALVLLAAHTAIVVIQWGILCTTLRSRLAGFDWQFCRAMLRSSWKFFGIDALVAVWASVNVVLLSWFSDEATVGVFAAAVQLLIPPGIALQAVVNSLFPVMCRRAEQGRERSRELALMMFQVLTFIAVPGCVLLWFGARPLITMVYRGEGFLDSAAIMRIMLPTLLLSSQTRLLGQLLMSHRREDINLRIVAVDLVFNSICGVILIYAFGVYGAAITFLLTCLVDFGLHYAATRRLLADGPEVSSDAKFVILWHTLVSSVLMASVLGIVGEAQLVWLLLIGIATFIASFATASCFFNGWTLVFREQFLLTRAEK